MNKKLLAVLAAGTLVAGASGTAMAFENEFHGLFRSFAYVSNFNGYQGSSAANIALSPFDYVRYTPEAGSTNLGAVPQAHRTFSYVEQRARLQYIAKASDDLKLVTHFEIDSRWGDAAYSTNRNYGGSVGADSVNIETKSVYLDFNTANTNFKVGIQPFIDDFKGIYLNADAAGAIATKKFGDTTAQLGFFRLDDDYKAGTTVLGSSSIIDPNVTTSAPGDRTRDLYVLNAKTALSKDMKVGGALYYLKDDRFPTANPGATKYYTMGVNAEMNAGPATVDAFFLYQTGQFDERADINAYAGQLAAKMKVGSAGTLRAAGLIASGEGNPNPDSSAFQVISNSAVTAGSESSYYPAEMLIMLRNKYNINTDQALVTTLNNGGRGFRGLFLGYDQKLTDKTYMSANMGFGWNDKQLAAELTRAGKFLGTEINATYGYKLADNFVAELQGGYFILGDYYYGTAEKYRNPYTTRLMLQYTF